MKAMSESVECLFCEGRGRVEAEITVDWVDRNGPGRSYRTRLVECDVCCGTGVVEVDYDEDEE